MSLWFFLNHCCWYWKFKKS